MPAKKNAPEQLSPETVTEHDLVFDCPECAKLLVIDERAAGLKINCPLCGKEISVPQQVHVTQAMEHHDAATLEEKRALLQKQIDENRMQHTEAMNKWHDHVTQVNRLKVRIQKLDQDHEKMEEQVKKLGEGRK